MYPTHSKKRQSLKDNILFIKAFLKSPAHVGAIFPSSRALADAMTSFEELPKTKTILELGCGTGAITEAILEKISPSATYIGIELNKNCVEHLSKRFPNNTFQYGSAERIQEYLQQYHLENAEAIISGLPWAVLPEEMQNKIFDAILHNLSADGIFVTFAYSHAKYMPRARRLKHRLEKYFDKVKTSPTIWKNVPPAFFYECRYPKQSLIKCYKQTKNETDLE